MDIEGLSTRAVADACGVSHSTIARAANGETVEIDTLIKITEWLGVPVETIINVSDNPDEVLEQIVMVLSVEPELSSVFGEIARKVSAKEMSPKVLSEIAAFASYRLQQHEATNKYAYEVEETNAS
jgi:transcriptional regulator with XRE-family HTH domain